MKRIRRTDIRYKVIRHMYGPNSTIRGSDLLCVSFISIFSLISVISAIKIGDKVGYIAI